VASTTTHERRHIRYTHRDQKVYRILCHAGEGEPQAMLGLVLDESHGGFACVFVGTPPPDGARFCHQENEAIRTPLLLRHQSAPADGIMILGFERADGLVRTDR